MSSAQMLLLNAAVLPNLAADDSETLLALARNAGMLVTLDGQIGREKYQSVAGSLPAFQRFAAALRDALEASCPR
ncbi:hypothetical protein [Paraburkholderia sp. J67]|uniref:hypothetical protein n=1 Tax=Paraburkholderia sp. J67 TaxID=2805435 RepID=UPI002ABE5301|nr:hypothetical protein [Paraburkholderia sp. J67]